MFRLTVFQPDQILNPGNTGGPDLQPFRRRYLAQGDSWFSIGAMPPFQTSNLLFEMRLQDRAYAVNCANPGDHLQHMLDGRLDPQFRRLMSPRFAPGRWDAILLSAGGNDLIDAAGVLPFYPDGSPVEPESRLLLRKDEWNGIGIARYVSASGLTRFRSHLVAQFQQLVALRDGEQFSHGIPIFAHCYDYIMPRNAPVRFFSGKKTWLYPAVLAYQIPEPDWFALSKYLLDELKNLLLSLNLPDLHIVDITGTLVPAPSGVEVPTLDWENEIHPTQTGYEKLARRYTHVIDRYFADADLRGIEHEVLKGARFGAPQSIFGMDSPV